MWEARNKGRVFPTPFEQAYKKHLANRGIRLGSAQGPENFDYRTYGTAGVDDIGDMDLEESHADDPYELESKAPEPGQSIEMQELEAEAVHIENADLHLSRQSRN